MMLLTPTMPASSVPRPTIQVSSPMPQKRLFTLVMNSAVVITHAARGSSGEMMWRAKTGVLTARSRMRGGTSLWPTAASMWIVRPMPNICWTSVAGRMIVRSTSLNVIMLLWRLRTPTTVNCDPWSRIVLPVGSSPPGKRSFQICVPIRQTLRLRSMSRSLI